jgi:hypothetical protein
MLSPDDVRAAYLFILGREPESEEVVAQLIARFSTIEEIRCEFLNSREFRTTTPVPDLAKPLDWRGAPIETNASPAQMGQMLRHIEAYWRDLDQPEVHWPLYENSDFWSSGLAERERHTAGAEQRLTAQQGGQGRRREQPDHRVTRSQTVIRPTPQPRISR